MQITAHRKTSGVHQLRSNGKVIGETWRYRGKASFGLRLNGYFWQKGCATTKGGFTTTSVKRMRDAVALATAVLTAQQKTC